MFIQEFFVNLCILVALIFFYTQVSAKYPLTRESSIRVKVITAMVAGILSNILMLFGISTFSGALVDLRHIPIIMIAYYGGFWPAMLTGLITLLGRFIISTDLASYMSLFVCLIGTLFAVYFSKTHFSKYMKVFVAVTIYHLVFSIAFSYLHFDIPFLIRELSVFWMISYLSAFTAFYLISYVRKSQYLFHKYRHESMTDPLTGVNNMRKFNMVYDELVQKAQKLNQSFALLFLDIDYFKQINDTYGHEAGDIALKELTYRMQYLAGTSAIVTRKGGEEFIILLPRKRLRDASVLAEDIREHVATHPFTLTMDKKVNLTISIGVSSYDETSPDPHYVLGDADEALYQAKERRNQVCIAGQEP